MIRPLLCTLFLSQAAIAVTYQPEWAAIAPKRVIQHTDSNGDALMKAVAALQPGDKLEIAAGTYSVDRMWDVSVSGSREAPIWITAAEGAQVIITRPDAKQNVINIGQSAPVAFLCLRGLEFTGGSHGMRLGHCNDVWIDQCHIHHTNGVCLSANSADTQRLHLTRNHIHHGAGHAEGMYLGANNGEHIMSESDPGPYPIPAEAWIEGGPQSDGDRHVLILDKDNWKLYEVFRAFPLNGGKSWKGGSGAIFDLKTSKPRPAGWTSADAAGLPILPGLARYDEICGAKKLTHALRFTVKKTRRAYVPPATHFASPHKDENLPPMGMRVRLKASFDTSKFTGAAKVILEGLKTHGMILADNGGDWFISGAPDDRWVHEDILPIRKVKGKDLEVVKMGPMTTR